MFLLDLVNEMEEKRPEVSEFDSVDPAPPSPIINVPELRATICDEEEKMFQRMRALFCLLYTSPSPRDLSTSRMPSSA